MPSFVRVWKVATRLLFDGMGLLERLNLITMWENRQVAKTEQDLVVWWHHAQEIGDEKALGVEGKVMIGV